jgi:exopolysaccharide biosynthesis polyprenyl glycosylphosphotransferase
LRLSEAPVTAPEDAAARDERDDLPDILVPSGFSGTPLTWCYRAIAVGLATTDALCAVTGLLLANLFLSRWARGGDLAQIGLALSVAWMAAFASFGLYSVRQLSALEEFRRLIGASCVATCLVTVLRAWANVPPYRRSLLITWLLALGLTLLTRRVWRWKLGCLRRSGHLAARTIIIGTNDEAVRLAGTLRQAHLGFVVLGHVTTAGSAEPTLRPVRVIGRINSLEYTIRAYGADCVFVASSAATADDLEAVGRASRYCGTEVRMSTNLADILVSRLAVQSCGDVLTLAVRPMRLGGGKAALKRAFDIVAGSVLCVLSLPVLLIVGLAVRISSPGPVLFRQDRITKGGRRFKMVKFRTMVHAPDETPDRLIDLTRPFFKVRDDPRITPVGRVLRKFSLDELPQLWLVVRGHLSLVGPRPLPADQVEANAHTLAPRHQVRAGVTGWWQVNGRSDVDADEALRLDLFYIENWSLSLDIFILLRTVGAVILRRGAC